MADQEFLASFGVDIDESGVSRLQRILTENKSLGADLAASFNAAAEGVKAFKESVSTDLPSLFGNGYGNVTENMFGAAGGLKIGLNMTEPKKENRALPLLRQLLGELSPAARASLVGGAGNVGTAALPAAMPSGNVTQNNQNVSAPVTINVNATGSNAEAIGESIYNTAERYLLRTLKAPY